MNWRLNIYGGFNLSGSFRDIIEYIKDLDYKDNMEIFIYENNDLKYYMNNKEDLNGFYNKFGIKYSATV
jgi:hypothetical protein